MHDWSIPITPAIIAEWASATRQNDADPDQPPPPLSANWAYRFIKRHQKDLLPRPQTTDEAKPDQTVDASQLMNWYDLLEIQLRDVPSRLVYNFDECLFRPTGGRGRRAIGVAGLAIPNSTIVSPGQNITVIECIAADGYLVEPFVVFTGEVLMIEWLTTPNGLPEETAFDVSPRGLTTRRNALNWLDRFNMLTSIPGRLKKGEQRVLIFDGPGLHLTAEFLSKCKDYNIIPFSLPPHSAHLCQPLDGKPFLNYKQHFEKLNNGMSAGAGTLNINPHEHSDKFLTDGVSRSALQQK